MSNRTITAILIALLLTPPLLAEDRSEDGGTSGRPELPAYRIIPGPAQAVLLALSDCKDVEEEDRPFQRYVWVPPWGKASWSLAMVYTANAAASRSSVIVRPELIQDGVLVRFDLRDLAPKSADFKELFVLWEKLGIEPYFTVPAKIEVTETDAKGKTTTVKRDVSAPGAHASPDEQTILRGLTQSGAPIVRADRFMFIMLSTLEGGLYYEFANIDKAGENDKDAKGNRQTDQQKWLWKFGAVEQVSVDLNADQRVGILISGVTDKPRRVDWFKGLAARESSGDVFLTHDTADEDVEAEQDPIRNLAHFKDRAREGIAPRSNGLQEYALFNAAGELQRSVPDNIARDGTIKFPTTSRLQPGIGCIRCHGPFDGLQPLPNDVKAMVESGEIDILGDHTASKDGRDAEIERLAAWYLGDATITLDRNRDDYERAVMRITKGRLPKNEGESEIAAMSRIVADIYRDYRYTHVSPRRACLELGYDVASDDDGVILLRALLPKLPPDINGVSPKDPILGALKSGRKVNRRHWDKVYPDAAFRAWRTAADYYAKQTRPGVQNEKAHDPGNPARGDEQRRPGE
jgi:hypothetical protein